jgi:WD40 repeat protein
MVDPIRHIETADGTPVEQTQRSPFARSLAVVMGTTDYSHGSPALVSPGKDAEPITRRLVRGQQCQELRQLQDHTDGVTSAGFSPGGKQIAITSGDADHAGQWLSRS